MLKCSYCETELPAGAFFCYICGTPVGSNPNSTTGASTAIKPFSAQAGYIPTDENAYLSPFLHDSERIPVPSVIHPLPQIPKRTNKESWVLLTIVILVIFVGAGSIYYGAVYQPALNAANIRATQAAATARAIDQANKLHAIYVKSTSSKPFLVDPLNNPPTSLWSEYQSPEYSDGSCFFKNKAFHVTVDTKSSMN